MITVRAVKSRYDSLNIQLIQSHQLMQNRQMVWRITQDCGVQEYWLEFDYILCKMIIVMNLR